MPSEKRERQRANRTAKMERLARQAKRRKAYKRGGIVLVLAAVVAGIVVAVQLTGGKAGKKSSATTTTAVSKGSYPCTPLPSQATGPIHFSTCPKMTINTAESYSAVVTTDVGSFTIQLEAKSAPVSVNNFVFLAEHGYYNGVKFHRVIPGFMMQGGDPTGSGSGGPGYEFTEHGPPAATNSSQQYPNYSVAMANSPGSADPANPSTNGSQFFVVDGSSGESLPPDYVLFGRVVSGTNVVDKIVGDGSQAGVPPTVTHTMVSVVIEVNGQPVTAASSSTSTAPGRAAGTTSTSAAGPAKTSTTKGK